MPTTQPRQRRTPRGLEARAAALAALHARLELRLSDELKRPLPCTARLQRLKRMKLRARDEIASIEGLVRALDRGRASRLH